MKKNIKAIRVIFNAARFSSNIFISCIILIIFGEFAPQLKELIPSIFFIATKILEYFELFVYHILNL